MREAVCMVCNDKRKFQTTVHDVERIANVLSRMVRETRKVTDHKLMRDISADKKHPHFMCGHCYHVNEMQLRNEEQKVHNYVYAFCEQIRNGQKVNVYDALRVLQGHYPILYRIVEKEYHKSKQ